MYSCIIHVKDTFLSNNNSEEFKLPACIEEFFNSHIHTHLYVYTYTSEYVHTYIN
jgi:hypothetical protein